MRHTKAAPKQRYRCGINVTSPSPNRRGAKPIPISKVREYSHGPGAESWSCPEAKRSQTPSIGAEPSCHLRRSQARPNTAGFSWCASNCLLVLRGYPGTRRSIAPSHLCRPSPRLGFSAMKDHPVTKHVRLLTCTVHHRPPSP